MSELNGTSPLTCGSCRHWHTMPVDPGNLGAPRNGQCRFNPPTPTAIVATAQKQIAISTNYPVTQANFAACSRHDSLARLRIMED